MTITTIDKAIVEVRTGSDSDFPKIAEVLTYFEEENVAHALRILSAHRTPHEMIEEAKRLGIENQVRACIAAAGGSAHIAGMTASEARVPVIGLPVTDSATGGLAALLSMIQMPPKIPNGVVGIEENTAAAAFAQRIAQFGESDEDQDFIHHNKIPIFANGYEFNSNELQKFGLDSRLVGNSELREPLGIYFLDLDKPIPEDLPFDIPIVVPIIHEPIFDIIKLDPGRKGSVQRTDYLEKVSTFYQGLLMPFSLHKYDTKRDDPIINASVYAAQIMALVDQDVKDKFDSYREEMGDIVRGNDKILQEVRAEGGRGF